MTHSHMDILAPSEPVALRGAQLDAQHDNHSASERLPEGSL